jgi:HD-GYP domain-containing protein (c-di-GMP phosphodiesterase class II)
MSRPLKLKVPGTARFDGFPTPRSRVHKGCLRGRTADVFRVLCEELGLIPQEVENGESGVSRWMGLARERDIDLHRHSLFVGGLTVEFSAYLGFAPSDQQSLARAAILHDIGKLEISLNVLHKPDSLTAAETLEMQRHPDIGHQMLTTEGGYETRVLAVVRDHHERLDGTGYPNGLLAKDISEAVRVVTVCDVYAAMTEPRPYGIPLGSKVALDLMATKQTSIDQNLVKQFRSMALRKVRLAP